jgi:predicted Ser/Thr protein kinase
MFDLIGKTIGPYRVIEQVGVGGMATVYKAYQPSMDRYVAIKILPHYLSQDPEFVKRFQREARAIARLEHAHILPVHDYGEYEGIAYIVMRYVEAGTLKDRMAQGQLPLDEIDRLIEQIGGALDYAHRLGVIHRDIKPGNVLLDTQGDTYLSDFGLARMMEATQQLTASGVGVGTPAYMSPEQGQGVKVDHRSDIYSLGVILYEMVTGRVPYEAETPMAVVIKHITDPLPLPRTVKPDVPEPIERVILRALAKDPAHRYQTAGEFVQALAVAVRKVSVPEAARPVVAEAAPTRREDVSLVTRVGRLWEQPRGKVALVGSGLAIVLLLGLLLSRLPGSIAIVGSGVTPTGTTAAIAQAATLTSAIAQATATSVVSKPTNTPGPTRTSAPTRTPAPTSTPTTHPARTFAEPILAAIADRPPDFEDDFSTGGHGWRSCESYRIENGSLEISVPEGETFGGAQHSQMWASDFVFQMDARADVLERDSNVGILLRENILFGGSYSVSLFPQLRGRWMIYDHVDGTDLAQGSAPDVVAMGQWMKVVIIARGSQFAVFVNDQPIDYFVDDTIPDGQNALSASGGGGGRADVKFDNVKFWNLENVPGLP